MSETTVIPCFQLSRPQLVARVAACMSTEGVANDSPFQLRPGFCCFCNHQLPAAYTKTTIENGQVVQTDYPHGHPGLTKRLNDIKLKGEHLGPFLIMVWLEGEHPSVGSYGLKRPGEFIPPSVIGGRMCCDAMNADVFNEASRVKRAKATEHARKQRIEHSAREKADAITRNQLAASMARKDRNAAPPSG